ncbi:MAG: GxxExxY protein [Bacteroides sp.]|nr:GxxExxY protein [Bacteroidales bacterium]MBD5303308.1 GxxExxY protein [Bacteroides sp.]
MALNPEYEKIGYDIIGCAFEVRRAVGGKLGEKYYRDALAWELNRLGYSVDRERPIKVKYKGEVIASPYFADLVIDDRVIIELKALRQFKEAEIRQIMTYLSLSDIRLGYLINFGVEDFRIGNLSSEHYPFIHGIYRIVNKI